jgi:hypothetical protein
MMGGGKMEVAFDAGLGRAVGSHIRMSGYAFGMPLSLDEVITDYRPPLAKVWETAGEQALPHSRWISYGLLNRARRPGCQIAALH